MVERGFPTDNLIAKTALSVKVFPGLYRSGASLQEAMILQQETGMAMRDTAGFSHAMKLRDCHLGQNDLDFMAFLKVFWHTPVFLVY